jgi:hypothetical protein
MTVSCQIWNPKLRLGLSRFKLVFIKILSLWPQVSNWKFRLVKTMSHATSDNDDACVSITPQTEAGGSSSNSSRRKRKSENGTVFRAWSFQLMVKADLCHGSTAADWFEWLESSFERKNVEQKYTNGIWADSEDEKSTNFERISKFIEDTLSIVPQSNIKEWRRVATKIGEHCHSTNQWLELCWNQVWNLFLDEIDV